MKPAWFRFRPRSRSTSLTSLYLRHHLRKNFDRMVVQTVRLIVAHRNGDHALITIDETIISCRRGQRTPPRRRGRNAHVSSVYRWSTVGCRGVVLESLQVGGTRCTSREALQRFFERLSQPVQVGAIGAGHCGNSRPDGLAIGGRLSCRGVVGIFDGRVACRDRRVSRSAPLLSRSMRSLRASKSLGAETGYAVSHPRQIALETRAVRGVESDSSEYDHGPAGHPQGKHIIDR
jgi:Protein of unknown function (DUF1580)